MLKLELPVIVRQITTEEESYYQIRPLFMNYPVINNRRFEKAMTLFQREVKMMFKGTEISRNNMNSLLWFNFNPEMSYNLFEFDINLGKQFFKGLFGVAQFKLKEHNFLHFPFLHNYMIMADLKSQKKSEIKDAAKDAIINYFRKMRKESQDGIDPQFFFSQKKEFVTTTEVNVNVRDGNFRFERSSRKGFFANMSSSSEVFIGADEVEKVGYEIGENYPNELKRAFYREEQVDRLYSIIYQKENTPIILVGASGVGKHTLIDEVVFRYKKASEKIGEDKQAKVWYLDPTRVISGMSIVGMWQRRMEAILKYLVRPNFSGVSYKLFIDNVIALLRIGKSSQNDMTLNDVIKPYLEERQLQLILSATPEEWKLLQEKDRRFCDLFQVIRVAEADLETATKIVLAKRKLIEKEHSCEFTTQALQQLFIIQRNYLKQKALPGSIVQLMDQLALKYRYNIVDAPEVRSEFEDTSGLNEKIFDTTQAFEKEEVKQFISRRLIGQEKASSALTDAIHSIKAKLNDPSKPLASFLFIGPTGVGKTQAAKILGQYLMGNEDQLLRFDMNEYIDGSAVHRLIGDYYNPEGQLTGKVRYQPFGIVLLDEIEKAHPSVHDLLLQVLDDGRLTDSLGRTVDFSNTIIVMTSNVGAKEVSSRLGFQNDVQDESAIYRKAVENRFRPEFINRIDQIVIFNPLELKHILSIARLQIQELLQRDGFVRRTTILNISSDALEWVAKRGFDSRMGGRALKRQIEKDLTTLSADQLISTYTESPIIFEINFDKDKLIPKIIPLEFIEQLDLDWLPYLPGIAQGRRFYNRLIKLTEKMERQVSRLEPRSSDNEDGLIVIGNQKGDQLNWEYYTLKDIIVETKGELQTIALGFKEKYYKEAPAVPLRLKASKVSYDNSKSLSFRAYRESMRDRLFQQEALAELSEAYEYGATEFDSMQTEFLNFYVDVAFLQIYTNGFIKDHNDQLELHFTSCINGMGKDEIKYLVNLYKGVFTEMDINFELKNPLGPISVEGYGLKPILKGELGIHLFYQAHRNPIPIMMQLKDLNRPKQKNEQFKVIRVYDNKITLTDLRTGYSNAMNITPQEFKILLFGGIVAQGKLRMPVL